MEALREARRLCKPDARLLIKAEWARQGLMRQTA
jgi:hypothetical protein